MQKLFKTSKKTNKNNSASEITIYKPTDSCPYCNMVCKFRGKCCVTGEDLEKINNYK